MTSRMLRAYGLRALVCAAAICLASSATLAGGTDPSPTRVKRPVTAAAVARSTVVVGAAWTANDTPIPNAHLRLRNVLTGKIAASTTSDDSGRFEFAGIESGSFAVELVND